MTAFQAFPWSDMYSQAGQFAPSLYQRTAQFQGLTRCPGDQGLYQQAPNLGPAQHYIQVQRPGGGSVQNFYQGAQRIVPAQSMYQPPRPTQSEFQTAERSECQGEPAGKKDQDSNNSKCDYSTVHKRPGSQCKQQMGSNGTLLQRGNSHRSMSTL